jgi:hypothetical protein
MVKQAAQLYPQQHYDFILDCGDNPAIVLQALRKGFKIIRFCGNIILTNKLRTIAQHYNATIIKH